MTRRTWFRTITGAFATLATGLGLRKVDAKSDMRDVKFWLPSNRGGYAYVIAWNDGERWHFEDVKPEEECDRCGG